MRAHGGNLRKQHRLPGTPHRHKLTLHSTSDLHIEHIRSLPFIEDKKDLRQMALTRGCLKLDNLVNTRLEKRKLLIRHRPPAFPNNEQPSTGNWQLATDNASLVSRSNRRQKNPPRAHHNLVLLIERQCPSPHHPIIPPRVRVPHPDHLDLRPNRI